MDNDNSLNKNIDYIIAILNSLRNREDVIINVTVTNEFAPASLTSQIGQAGSEFGDIIGKNYDIYIRTGKDATRSSRP